MLMPKRTKYRKQFRGKMKGKSNRGNQIAHGQYGLVALEPAWITNRQIEAARIAMTRYIRRGGQKFFPINRLLPNLPKHVWAAVKVHRNIG